LLILANLVFARCNKVEQDVVGRGVEIVDPTLPVNPSVVNERDSVCDCEARMHIVRDDNSSHAQAVIEILD
jgi:hypothetical protein